MPTDRCPACVLLIEDDEQIREAIGSFLEDRGYATVPAEDGEQALDLLETIQRPCLVLVDLLTHGIDCNSLLAALAPSDRMATLPMVLVSVSAPHLLSRPAVVKRPIDLEIVFRIVRDHCCGEDRGGEKVGTETVPERS
jgi:CheY-like chemotaxis protein